MRDGELVRMVISSKVWQVTRKMANTTINIAKQKYEKEGVKAIVAVEKDGIIALQKDVHESTEAFEKAKQDWISGGYICYYTK